VSPPVIQREPIDVALWNLIADNPGIKGQIVTSGRYLIPIEEMTPSQYPALFMVQHGESWTKAGKGIDAKRTLQRSFVMYAWTPKQDQTYPATQINGLMDVLDAVIEFPNRPDNAQTLGGLVEHVYIEGEVVIVEGVIGDGNASVLIAPMTIVIP
jgi:hypothetical protein